MTRRDLMFGILFMTGVAALCALIYWVLVHLPELIR